jgi:nitronate monooxygenase/enoyl-[acyl-carrier protein] reductase II
VRRLRTGLCDRTGLGIELPMIQAPVGSAAGPELVASEQAATRVGLLHSLAVW